MWTLYYSIRYQGEEGWAPAMFLKRVSSDESFTSMEREKDTFDSVSFNGGMLLKPFLPYIKKASC